MSMASRLKLRIPVNFGSVNDIISFVEHGAGMCGIEVTSRRVLKTGLLSKMIYFEIVGEDDQLERFYAGYNKGMSEAYGVVPKIIDNRPDGPSI